MTVRPIDRFVGAMHRDRGDELAFETGRPVRLKIGNAERVLLAQEVRTDQIENLLREVTPPDCQRIFEDTNEVSFPYSAPTGAVMVFLLKKDQKMKALVRPYASAQRRPGTPAKSVIGATALVSQAVPVESTMVIESPLESIGGGNPGMSIVTGAPMAGRRGQVPSRVRQVIEGQQGPGGAPKRGAALDMAGEVYREGPMELPMVESVAPPALPLEAMTPLPVSEPPQAPPFAGRQPPPAPPKTNAGIERQAYVEPPATSGAKIDRILRTLVTEKGSDLHLTANLSPKMRKDGDIAPVPGFESVLSSDTIRDWLLEIAPQNMREKFEATNDADYAYEIRGIARFRVNVFRDRRGVGGVMRVIPSEILTADKLKLPPVVRDLCSLQKGLVVVTGPTGSGKSTTLAAMIDLINKSRSDHVITIEDPVEFVHEPQRCLVNQREVHSHTQSFSAALRAALREDPDIVLVGEMRDLETVSIAIETAETGHLVFGTLHTNTAVSTVDRIIDQFPTDRQSQVRVMLSESLKGVIAQTLCKKIGGGRAAALEILLVLPAVANMIREGKTFQIPSIMQTGKSAGMQTLNDALVAMVKDGVIDPKEAYTKAVARSEMKAMLERAGHRLD